MFLSMSSTVTWWFIFWLQVQLWINKFWIWPRISSIFFYFHVFFFATVAIFATKVWSSLIRWLEPSGRTKSMTTTLEVVWSARFADCAPVWQGHWFTRSICQVYWFEKRRPTPHEGISCTCKISQFLPSQFLLTFGKFNWGLIRSLGPSRWTKSKSKGHWRNCVCRISSLPICRICCRTWLTRKISQCVKSLRFEKCEGSLQARKHLKNTFHTFTKRFWNSTWSFSDH